MSELILVIHPNEFWQVEKIFIYVNVAAGQVPPL